MKIIKWAGGVLLVLLLLLAAAVAWFALRFDANAYRDTLSTLVEEQTGRPLTLAGPISLKVFPVIAVEADDVRLGNAPGFHAQFMASVAQASARLAIGPLLRGQVNVASVDVRGLSLELETLPDGRANWDDLLDGSEASAAGEGQDHALALAVSEVRVHDARVLWREASTDAYALTLSELTAGPIRADTPLRVSAAGAVEDLTAAASYGFDLQAGIELPKDELVVDSLELVLQTPQSEQPLQIRSERIALSGPEFELAPAVVEIVSGGINARLTVADGALAGDRPLNGQLTLPETKVAALLASLGAAPGEDLRPDALGSVRIQTGLQLTPASGVVEVLGFVAHVLGGTVQADLRYGPAEAADRSAAASLMTGSLRSEGIALAPLFAALPALTEALPAPGAREGALSASSAIRFEPDTGVLVLDNLDLRLWEMRIQGQLRGTPEQTPEAALAWEGQLQVPAFDLGNLLERLDLRPDTASKNVLKQAALTTRVGTSEDTYRLRDLDLRLDDSRVRGSVGMAGEPARYTLDLTVDQLALDGYLPPDSEAAEDEVVGDMALPLEDVGSLAVDGRLRIGRLTAAGLALDALDVTVSAGQGRLTLEPLSASLYEGTFKGSMQVDVRAEQPQLQLAGQASGVQLAPLLTAAAGTAAATGRATVGFDLSGQGSTLNETLRSSNGEFSMNLADGVLTGMHLGHTLCVAYNRLQRLPAPAPVDPVTTPLQQLSMSARVVAGEATTEDFTARNAYLAVQGSGRLRLARQSLDFGIQAELADKLGIPGCEDLSRYVGVQIPVRITGSLADPTVRPDFATFLKKAVRDKVQEKITEKLFDIFGPKEQAPETP